MLVYQRVNGTTICVGFTDQQQGPHHPMFQQWLPPYPMIHRHFRFENATASKRRGRTKIAMLLLIYIYVWLKLIIDVGLFISTFIFICVYACTHICHFESHHYPLTSKLIPHIITVSLQCCIIQRLNQIKSQCSIDEFNLLKQ